MSTAEVTNTGLAAKCLEFCQALASQRSTFNFSLTLGTSFSFSLSTQEKEAPATANTRKKPSPSTQRRNLKRKELYLEKMKPFSPATKECKEVVYKCDDCELESTLENGVSVHMEEVHRKDYTEMDVETNHDKIPQIDGGVDEEAVEDDAKVKNLIKDKIKQFETAKLRNMSKKELSDVEIEISKDVMIRMLQLKLFHTVNCGASNIKAIVNDIIKDYMKGS